MLSFSTQLQPQKPGLKLDNHSSSIDQKSYKKEDYERYIKSIEKNARTLTSFQNGTKVDFFAVVMESTQPTQTKGKDLCSRWYIWDPTMPDKNEFTIMNVFRRTALDFPSVQSGSPIYGKNISVGMFNNKIQLTSFTSNTSFIDVLDPNNALNPFQSIAKILTQQWNSLNSKKYQATSVYKPKPQTLSSNQGTSAISLTSKRKQLKMSEIQLTIKYFDFIGEVLGIEESGGQTEIKVTDYTTSDIFPEEVLSDLSKYNYFPCTLWGVVGQQAHGLKKGDIVFLKNVHLRLKDGGVKVSIHEDRTYPDKVMVSKLDNSHPDAQGLLNLKKSWNAKYGPPTSVLDDNSDLAIQSTSQISSLPVPNKFKLRAVVLDHLPSDIRNFTRIICPECYKTFPSIENPVISKCTQCGLCDFLGGLEPSNLFKSSSDLKILKERLSKLWNIEASKNECPLEDPRGFDVAVKSFYAETSQGERFVQYKLFNTVLNV